MKSSFTDLGVGVGLRPAHYSRFIENIPKSISWVEVVSENFIPWKTEGFGASIRMLEKIRAEIPVALHGVSMNLGSTDDLDLDYLQRLKELVKRIEPVVVSDHLAWTGIDGFNMHDLFPVPYTEESLANFVRKIDQVQTYLGRKILIENPSTYFEFRNAEMTEPEFINEVLKKSDCGLLLDLNNVYVSSVNHGFNPIEYLKKLDFEKVGQIHVAGHSEMDGHLIDTHDADVHEEVWNLLAWVFQKMGSYSVMIERDGNIPDWSVLENEINLMKKVRHEKE